MSARCFVMLVSFSLLVPLVSADEALPVVIIKDIESGPGSSSPAYLIEINGTLYFSAYNGANSTDNELWRSDGTEAGTVLVKDIFEGPDSSWLSQMTDAGGTLFFSAKDGVNGYELWKSDGTEAGTVLVKNIYPGSTSSSPRFLTDLNGTLIFVARDVAGPSGGMLLKSDGTAAGTVLVNDGTEPGTYNYQPVFSSGFNAFLTRVDDSVFFAAKPLHPYVSTGGVELWKTDGTAIGTVLVRNINSGYDDSNPTRLIDINGTLFFAADDGDTGKELWTSDGTEAGTQMVTDICPGFCGSIGISGDFGTTANFKGQLFFFADDGVHGEELWKSDGTAAGTVMVKDIRSGTEGSDIYSLLTVGDTLFFRADDGVVGTRLWKTDGTTAGTVAVGDHPSSAPLALTEFDGLLYFSGYSIEAGRELWVSDGTSNGTMQVYDLNTGPYDASPGNFGILKGALVFSATDGATGYELWKLVCPQEFGVCGEPFEVNSVGDSVDQVIDGFCATGNTVGAEDECTLRAAIQESNATEGIQKVTFDIPPGQATGGVFIINVGSSLPHVSGPAVIDATTQPGYLPGSPVVELKGPGVTSPVWGLQISAGDTAIRGFSIYGFGKNGILMEDEGGNVIESNIVGSNAQSIAAPGNGEDGILVLNSSGNVIGGSAPAKRNVISRNGLSGTGGCGIALQSSSDNRVIGNFVGTDVTGMQSRENVGSGVCVINSGFNAIGGSGPNDGNVISGNSKNGIIIRDAQSGSNSILANIVGLNQAGDGVVANGHNGVLVSLAGVGNLIGDGTTAGRNTISGNAWSGIDVSAGSGSNEIDGNFIGTNAAGNAARANDVGILIRDSPTNRIGVNGGNAISGNTGHGLLVTGDYTDSTQIQDNFIGADITGLVPLGNWLDGVRVSGARNTIITGNVIAANGGYGVAIFGADEFGATNPNQANAGNLVSSNFVGADIGGSILGNGIDGVTINDSSRNRVSDNIIQSNGSAGVTVVNLTWGSGNLISGNEIFANTALGIDLGSDFVTPNDPFDADLGANALQNFPVVTTVIGQPLNLVLGTLHSAPFKTYTVEVFSNSAADPSDYGEGEIFEGAFTVTTDAAGDGFLLAGFGQGNSGGCITATARDRSTGDTSEFSFCETIPPPPGPMDLDFGDAPDGDGGYPTLLINNGARHQINLGVFMGSLVDGDPNGQPNNDATGDDGDGSSDEDGIDFVGPLVAHSFPASVRVSVNSIGKLNAWIDFNGDGDWDDESDRIFTDEPLVPGPNNVSFITPAESIAGETFARFRFSTEGGLGPIGPALDGEVEDYGVEIIDSDDVIFIDGFESAGFTAWSSSVP